MTYCVAMLVDTGLVFLSDSRTSAGIDQVSTFRKTTVFEAPGDRVLVVQTAGNLAISQAVLTLLRERILGNEERPTLMNVQTLYDAAKCVGDAFRDVHSRDAESLKTFGLEFNTTAIVGGQIRGETPRLFTVYSAGNFIEASADTTYFQIGELKYGKPIMDRVLRRSSSLNEAAKCALISMDSTIRSNLSVGAPLDLVMVKRDHYRVARHLNISEDDDYFRAIRSRWSEALRHAFAALPDADWLQGPPR